MPWERVLRSLRVTRERAALVGLFNDSPRHFDPEHSLDELAGLAAAAGADVVLRVLQERAKPDPATFLGSGKVDVARGRVRRSARRRRHLRQRAVSPAQLRNLEGALDRKVSIARSSSSTSSRGARGRGKASCRSSSRSSNT